MKQYIFKHNGNKVGRPDKESLNGHGSFVIWFTGLSGSGKSTIASEVEHLLFKKGIRTVLLDGDNLRFGLNKDLGFSERDRGENIRRASEVAKLFVDSGVVVLASFISPYESDRKKAKNIFKKGEFIEVFVKCNLEECKKRDPKKLYANAHKGVVSEFTGVSAPYEEPQKPDLVLESDKKNVHELANQVILYLEKNHYLK